MDHIPSAIRHALDTIEAFQFGPQEFSARELHEIYIACGLAGAIAVPANISSKEDLQRVVKQL